VLRRFSIAVILVGFAFGVNAFAQEDAPLIDPARIPATGTAPSDFAPSGWEVEQNVSSDLNGDGISPKPLS
jgi:hypothetical protein